MKKPDNITNLDWDLLKVKYKNLSKVVKKLNKNYPVQYLIGNVDFCGLTILVNEKVLIPRFETEYLIEKTLNYINDLDFKKCSVLDIGTGSGCIAITLKAKHSLLDITALDIAKKAIKTAKKNAKLNKCKINFIHKDMFKYKPLNKYNIIISNPPYIGMLDSIDEKIKYEPSIAIYGGLDFYEQIFKIAKESLTPKHLIALEIDEDMGKDLTDLALKYFPNEVIKIEKDFAEKDRYMFIMNK